MSEDGEMKDRISEKIRSNGQSMVGKNMDSAKAQRVILKPWVPEVFIVVANL